MLIIKPELVLLIVPLRIMEPTETPLSECVCLYAQGCNFPTYRQVIAYQSVLGILIFMDSCRTSHASKNVIRPIHSMLKRCVALCPVSQKYYGDPSAHKCVLKCPSTPSLYADNITQTCVHICPNDTYGTPVTRAC